MKIAQFFASLLPNFERSSMLEDIEESRTDVKDNLLPAYRGAKQYMNSKSFKAKLLTTFNALFIRALPQYARVGFVEGTFDILGSNLARLEILEGQVMALFAKDVTKDAITYRKAAVIRYLELVRFVNQYAARSLLRFLAAETNALNGAAGAQDAQLTPMELRWLVDNQSAYLDSLKVLSHSPGELVSMLEQIPDIVVVPDRMDMVKQTVGNDKLDPFQMNLISYSFDANINPIYHLRMVAAEYQVKKYQMKLEEKRVLELRLLAMKEAASGKQDAKLSQLIEYSEGRLSKLNHAIDQLTRDYA